MKYRVDPWLFEKNPNLYFGIIIGKNLVNAATSEEDSKILEQFENSLRSRIKPEELKTHDDYMVYREALTHVNINPNKFTHSVEAMSKRVLKGDQLPRINALVDLCNAISLKEIISLGGHDLVSIDKDLEVRLSVEGDRFLPFGSSEFEQVAPGEVVFTSGNTIQTRQWLWRQSELGKMTLDTKDVFFQLVGFYGPCQYKIENALNDLETLIVERFKGSVQRFVVNKDQMEIEFHK